VKQTAKDWILFKFHLNALLSAAQSITLVMQKEYAHATGFESWYEHQQEEMRKGNLLTFQRTAKYISPSKTCQSQIPIFLYCGRYICYAKWFYNCAG
jgi:hypothetical protein